MSQTSHTAMGGGNTKVGKYSKKFPNISKAESHTLLKHFDKSLVDSSATRNANIQHILRIRPDLRPNHDERYFYFEVYEKNGKKYRSAKEETDVDDTNLYPEQPGTGPKIDINAIIAHMIKNETDAEDDDEIVEDELEPNQHNQLNQTQFASAAETLGNRSIELENRSLRKELEEERARNAYDMTKMLHVNTKYLKYNEDDGVSHFLRSIDNFARAKNICSEASKIQFAQEILSQSGAKGNELMDLCNDADFKNWSRFSEKLYLMEASSMRSFEIKFKNYKRQADQPCAKLMANLKKLYLKSKGLPDRYVLTGRDIENVRGRFMDCLDPKVAGFLQDRIDANASQEHNFSELDVIAQQCQKVEENHQLGLYGRTTAIHHVETVDKTEERINALALEVKRAVNAVEAAVKQQSRPRQNQRKPNMPSTRILQGFCLQKLRSPDGQCRRRGCTYNHGHPPPEVMYHFNKSFNTNH